MKKILCLFLSLAFLSFMHPHYLSVADLKYNKKENRLQGFVKIFTHDFENTLKKLHKKPVDLINPTDTLATRKLLEQYLSTHLLINANQKPVVYHVIGFENEHESIYMYVESESCEQPKTLDIQNTLLYESYREQTNIVHLDVNGVRKSQKVTNPAETLKFEF